MIELLFTDPKDCWVTEAWEALREQRHQLLTQEVAKSYLGYVTGNCAKLANPSKVDSCAREILCDHV